MARKFPVRVFREFWQRAAYSQCFSESILGNWHQISRISLYFPCTTGKSSRDGFARDCPHRHHLSHRFNWLFCRFDARIRAVVSGTYRHCRIPGWDGETERSRIMRSQCENISGGLFFGTTRADDGGVFGRLSGPSPTFIGTVRPFAWAKGRLRCGLRSKRA